MNITIYKTTNAKKDINKALASIATLSGAIANDDISVLNPVIKVSENPNNANYMYIEEFNRYYFITEVNAYRNGLYLISGRVDVLYTYKDAILKNRAIIDKSANIGNASKYLNDGSYNATSKQYINAYTFANADGYTNFTDTPQNILITAG